MTDNERPSPKSDSLTPERLWVTIGPTVEADLTEKLADLITGNALKSKRQPTEDIEEALRSEAEFTKLVSGSVFEAMRLNPGASEYTVLFDLDETVVSAPVDYDPLHLVRPAMAPLLAALKSVDPRVRFGILTTRSREYLEGELANPSQLAEMMPYLDPDLLFSSRDIYLESPSPRYTNEQAGFTYNETIAKKIAVCDELIASDSSRTVILVDDLPGLDKVDVDTHFRTVALASSPARFSLLQY